MGGTRHDDPTKPAGAAGRRTSDADGRKARWAEHRRARRQALVEAAIAAIGRHGPGLGMDDIAAEAGVTKPVVYRYFTDRADLYVAVGEQVAGAMLARLQVSLAASPRDPKQTIVAGVDTYLAFIEQAPDVYRFVVNRPFVDKLGAVDLESDYRGLIVASVARTVGEQLRAAGLDSGGAEAWAAGIVGFVQAAGDAWLDRRTMSRADLTTYVAGFLWGGFAGLSSDAVEVAAGRPARSTGASGLRLVQEQPGG